MCRIKLIMHHPTSQILKKKKKLSGLAYRFAEKYSNVFNITLVHEIVIIFIRIEQMSVKKMKYCKSIKILGILRR